MQLMIKKAVLVLSFVALIGVTLSQVSSVEAGNQIKPTSPKVHPTPKPKPTSPKSGQSGTSYSGASRIFGLN